MKKRGADTFDIAARRSAKLVVLGCLLVDPRRIEIEADCAMNSRGASTIAITESYLNTSFTTFPNSTPIITIIFYPKASSASVSKSAYSLSKIRNAQPAINVPIITAIRVATRTRIVRTNWSASRPVATTMPKFLSKYTVLWPSACRGEHAQKPCRQADQQGARYRRHLPWQTIRFTLPGVQAHPQVALSVIYNHADRPGKDAISVPAGPQCISVIEDLRGSEFTPACSCTENDSPGLLGSKTDVVSTCSYACDTAVLRRRILDVCRRRFGVRAASIALLS